MQLSYPVRDFTPEPTHVFNQTQTLGNCLNRLRSGDYRWSAVNGFARDQWEDEFHRAQTLPTVDAHDLNTQLFDHANRCMVEAHRRGYHPKHPTLPENELYNEYGKRVEPGEVRPHHLLNLWGLLPW